tara:strand:+ start:532 stop:789 length:258 start_codon:yes stop_codon:yes gene_type:complete
MAEKAKVEEVKNIDLDMEKLTIKGKVHAEQYNAMKLAKLNHQVEIEKIDVLMNYYTGTIQAEAKKWAEENPEDAKKEKSDKKEDK